MNQESWVVFPTHHFHLLLLLLFLFLLLLLGFGCDGENSGGYLAWERERESTDISTTSDVTTDIKAFYKHGLKCTKLVNHKINVFHYILQGQDWIVKWATEKKKGQRFYNNKHDGQENDESLQGGFEIICKSIRSGISFPELIISEKGKAKQADVLRRLSAHLLLLLLFGNLQSWWVGEGGGLTVGAVLHLRHLKKRGE